MRSIRSKIFRTVGHRACYWYFQRTKVAWHHGWGHRDQVRVWVSVCFVVQLSDSVTPWTVACQTSLSLGFSSKEYWSGLPCPPPGDFPNPGIEPRSPTLQEMVTHSSILAWRIPWMEDPDRLQSMGSQRVGHDWATSLSLPHCRWTLYCRSRQKAEVHVWDSFKSWLRVRLRPSIRQWDLFMG